MWFLNRLKEKTTWVGLIGYLVSILGYYGVVIPDDLQPIISEIGFLVTSAVLIFMKERK